MTRLALVTGLLSSLALAQTKVVEEKKVVTINEIERGFFFEARGGFWGTFNPPAGTGSATYFSPGQAVEVDLGFDIGERVSIALSILGTFNRMRSDYTGFSGGTATGDYAALIPGGGVKVRVAGFADAQEVRRTWIYVRIAGGAVLFNPTKLIDKIDALVSGGIGVEYFTKLRHFSIGAEANVNFGVLTQAVGFSILPTVKYSF
jgi:hypothetical protein